MQADMNPTMFPTGEGLTCWANPTLLGSEPYSVGLPTLLGSEPYSVGFKVQGFVWHAGSDTNASSWADCGEACWLSDS